MSIWFNLKKYTNYSVLTLWNWIVKSKLTPTEIAIDFFSSNDDQYKEMLLFLYQNQQFVINHWKISFPQFMFEFLLFVIRIDSVECMEFFIKELKLNPAMNNNSLIWTASRFGRVKIVRLLLQHERIDPSAKDNLAIKWASWNGHTEVVHLLLQDERIDPSADYNLAVRYASKNGHTEIVRMLLQDERVDPSTCDNLAIRWASSCGHLQVVRLLLQHERVLSKMTPELFNMLQKHFPHLKEDTRKRRKINKVFTT